MRSFIRYGMVIVLLFGVLGSAVLANTSGAEIQNVSLEYDKKSGTMTASGTISSGPGKQVTLKVANPKGALIHLNQVASGEDGSFRSAFVVPATNLEGKYTLSVGGHGVGAIVKKTLELGKVKPPKDKPEKPEKPGKDKPEKDKPEKDKPNKGN